MTPEERIAKFREGYEKKRQAIATRPTERKPRCRCGLNMVKHWSGGHYWCPVCEVLETELRA